MSDTVVTITEDGVARNVFGTPVSVHQCEVCGHWVTLCPAVDQRDPDWQVCLSFDCASYDVERDADLTFEIEPWRIRKVD